jgi:HK97 family phage prohead protease
MPLTLPTIEDRICSPHARRFLSATEPRLQLEGKAAEGQGELVGYAAVWDALDTEREAFERGAFTRTIAQVVPAGRVPLMVRHMAGGGDVMETIGWIVEAREDDYGLLIRAHYTPSEFAQEARRRINAGEAKFLSVGFEPLEWRVKNEDGQRVLIHTQVRLVETIVTNNPININAVILSSKAQENPQPGDTQDAAAPPAAAPGDTSQSAQAPAGATPSADPAPPEPQQPSYEPVAPAIERDLALRRAQLDALKLNA